jgi:uncharacterized membrane protein YoaK (UPF0700 family)
MSVMSSGRAAQHTPICAISEKSLTMILALIAGMVDLTSFVTLGGVFTAHITGNLVVLAAVAVQGRSFNPAQALAVPVFMAATTAVWLMVRSKRKEDGAPSRSVLVLQFLLLLAVLAVCVGGDAAEHPRGLLAGAAVLLAASAMAAQNALLHLQIRGAPSTAVMTGNLVSVVISALDAFSSIPDRRAQARARLGSVLPLLAGFLLGCTLSAVVLLLDRNWGWSLPAALAGLVAILPWRPEP